MKAATNRYSGHRQRLKAQFMNSQDMQLPEYQFLELVLFYTNPRKDMKPLAKDLLKNYGNYNNVINAPVTELLQFKDLSNSAITLFKILKESSNRMLYAKLDQKPVITHLSCVINYLRSSMAYSSKEQFRILFLNKKNHIIANKVIAEGTIDQVAIYPREIAKLTLDFSASAIILVHNHPSGKANPSHMDINVTKKIVSVLKPFDILVHDHIIISTNEEFSFKSNGLI